MAHLSHVSDAMTSCRDTRLGVNIVVSMSVTLLLGCSGLWINPNLWIFWLCSKTTVDRILYWCVGSTICLIFIVSNKDPGHIPPGWHPTDMTEDESRIRLGYCAMCDRVKALRSHHCYHCNVCHLKMDHHCYLLGQCIGYKNQMYFYTLISIATLLVTVIFLLYFDQMIEEFIHSNWSVGHIFLTVFISIPANGLISLFLLHTKFMLENSTTIEYLFEERGRLIRHKLQELISNSNEPTIPPPYVNPFNVNALHNFYQVLLGDGTDGLEWQVREGFDKYSILQEKSWQHSQRHVPIPRPNISLVICEECLPY